MKKPIAWPTVAVLGLAIALLVVIWRFLPGHTEALLLGGAISSLVLAQMQRLLGGGK